MKSKKILKDNKEVPANSAGFEELFTQYYGPLVVFACRYVDDIETAREIVQDFFVKYYEKYFMLTIESSQKAYLYRAVYNSCLNYINQKNIQEKHLRNINYEQEEEQNIEPEIHTIELQQKIYAVINQLPERCKKIFIMNRLEGLKNEEIAKQLNISKRTVETQISKALRILRKKLI